MQKIEYTPSKQSCILHTGRLRYGGAADICRLRGPADRVRFAEPLRKPLRCSTVVKTTRLSYCSKHDSGASDVSARPIGYESIPSMPHPTAQTHTKHDGQALLVLSCPEPTAAVSWGRNAGEITMKYSPQRFCCSHCTCMHRPEAATAHRFTWAWLPRPLSLAINTREMGAPTWRQRHHRRISK